MPLGAHAASCGIVFPLSPRKERGDRHLELRAGPGHRRRAPRHMVAPLVVDLGEEGLGEEGSGGRPKG